MKRSQKLKVLAALMTMAGMLLAFAWFIVSMAIGIELRMNGPWLIAVLACAIGAILAFGSMVAEERERREQRDKRRALERAVAAGVMTVNDARREMGLPEYKRGQS